MRLKDYEQGPNNSNLFYMITGVLFFIVLLVSLLFFLNRPATDQTEEKTDVETDDEAVISENDLTAEIQNAANSDLEDLLNGNEFTSDDLDFWDLYPEDSEENENLEKTEENKDVDEQNELEESENMEISEGDLPPEDVEEETDMSYGGKYTLITYADGTEEWVPVNSYLEKNEYQLTGFVKDGSTITYEENGRTKSEAGIDISKYQGDIDFAKVKKAGIDFVMIRVGARGYETGNITLDSSFEENIEAALDEGLKVGVYFFSQAVNKAEAEEEAEFVLENIKDYDVSYPVVFDMEEIEGVESRISDLTKSQRTEIAAGFLNVIKTAGYQPMLYGNKEWLIKKFELGILSSTDIWLSQESDVPDYPYQFTMWQYTTKGTISGIIGNVDINICFIDYDLR